MPYAEAASVDVDGLSFDVFHHQIRLAVLAMTGVQQAGDVGMRQGRQNLPLRQKAPAQLRIVRSGPQELHGYPLRYFSVHAFGQINGPMPPRPRRSPSRYGPQTHVFRLKPRQAPVAQPGRFPFPAKCLTANRTLPAPPLRVRVFVSMPCSAKYRARAFHGQVRHLVKDSSTRILIRYLSDLDSDRRCHGDTECLYLAEPLQMELRL